MYSLFLFFVSVYCLLFLRILFFFYCFFDIFSLLFSFVFFFFFSSRRRHTRLVSDWSSDVCSSDLAPEALDDVAVSQRVAKRVLCFRKRRERSGELASLQLVLERLAVLEGQVGEHALDRQHVAIVSSVNRVTRRLQRQRVGGKRARRAAEKLARELVERDDAREAIGAALQPFPPGAGSELFVKRQKAPAHLGVERRVLLEPALVPPAVFLACAEPEAQHA